MPRVEVTGDGVVVAGPVVRRELLEDMEDVVVLLLLVDRPSLTRLLLLSASRFGAVVGWRASAWSFVINSAATLFHARRLEDSAEREGSFSAGVVALTVSNDTGGLRNSVTESFFVFFTFGDRCLCTGIVGSTMGIGFDAGGEDVLVAGGTEDSGTVVDSTGRSFSLFTTVVMATGGTDDSGAVVDITGRSLSLLTTVVVATDAVQSTFDRLPRLRLFLDDRDFLGCEAVVVVVVVRFAGDAETVVFFTSGVYIGSTSVIDSSVIRSIVSLSGVT